MQILRFAILFVLLGLRLAIAGESISQGEIFKSPDGLYSVRLAEVDGTKRFIISNKKDIVVDNSIFMPTILLRLSWNVDSRSFLTVEHIAGGDYARLIYVESGKWAVNQYGPSGKGIMKYSITELLMKPDRIFIRYVISDQNEIGHTIGNRFCEFNIDLKTKQKRDERCGPISKADLVKELSKNAVLK